MADSYEAAVVLKAENILLNVKGIRGVIRLESEDLNKIMKLESVAESRAAMGIGKGFNEGLREVAKRELVLAVANDNEFRHASEPTVYLVSEGEIIGREVTDKREAHKFRENSEIIFIGDNFIVFRDKLRKVKGRDAYFSFPSLPFPELEGLSEVKNVVSASPSGAVDIYIKQKAGWNWEDPKLGTILIGFNLRRSDK